MMKSLVLNELPLNLFKCQHHKMVKHTQTILRQFVGLVLRGLSCSDSFFVGFSFNIETLKSKNKGFQKKF